MARVDDQTSLGAVSADLARRWASQRLGAVQAYGRILADYSTGRSSGSAAAGAFAKLVAEEAVRYPADAIGLATDFAGALVRKAGVSLDTVSSTAADAATAVLRPIQDLEISGPLGGLASGDFLLRNPHATVAAVSFITSSFTGPAGDTPSSILIEPTEMRLEAGEEQMVTVVAELDPGTFEAGGRYLANVAINGFDEMVVRVRLTVLPA